MMASQQAYSFGNAMTCAAGSFTAGQLETTCMAIGIQGRRIHCSSFDCIVKYDWDFSSNWSNKGIMIRVILPTHLRNLAHVGSEVTLEVAAPVTTRSVLDALEAQYPMLRGTIRDHGTLQRRAFLRYFACEEDVSHESPDSPLPEAV